MAKLRKTLTVDVEDEKAVEAACADLKKFCASGTPQGEARLVLEFDAPDLETARRRKADGDDDGAESDKD